MLFSGPLPRETTLPTSGQVLPLGPAPFCMISRAFADFRQKRQTSHSGICARLQTGQKRVGGGLGRVRT